ncbi:MAG: hypothetical protein GY754_26125 [bacterium]|nr:hypothetical protein [bacterium]
MNFKKKINLILAFGIILCIGSYFIISLIFQKLENQLHEKCRVEALMGARVMSNYMEFMIHANIIPEEDIFDTNYKYIEGTNKEKAHTKYDRIFDKYIQKIEDQFLVDPDVDYAILIDKKGYVPTHNSKYSKPGEDPLKNRTKRNFAGKPGIKAALQYRGDGTSQRLYDRDTGETIWNIGAPVEVNGKHWGAFLVGVSVNRINILKNQMLILVITILVVIISLTMLALLAVTPRRLLSPEEEDEDASFEI